MARVTVEDCTKNVDSLFDLVLLASHRAKVLNAGNEAQVPLDNDKSTVIAVSYTHLTLPTMQVV